jgi:hypothetical protein
LTGCCVASWQLASIIRLLLPLVTSTAFVFPPLNQKEIDSYSFFVCPSFSSIKDDDDDDDCRLFIRSNPLSV